MLLKLWPDQTIFMDGHTHIYGETLTREYENIITLSNDWQNIFEKYQIIWVIVRSQSPVGKILEDEKWQIIYQDQTAIILKRRP